MNKREIKKTLKGLIQEFIELRDKFEMLKEEVDFTSGEIEPYENRYDLTPQQEERVEWLESLSYALEDIIYFDIEDTMSEFVEVDY